MHYLLDGYNIIHKIDSFRSPSLQKSREKLIKYIQIKKPQGRNQVTIVFDGKAEVIDYPIDTSPVQIVFTHSMSADEYIIRLIKKSDNPKLTVAISDDKEIQEKAHLLGAKVSEVKDFFKSEKRKEIKKDKSKLSFKEFQEIKEELINRKEIIS